MASASSMFTTESRSTVVHQERLKRGRQLLHQAPLLLSRRTAAEQDHRVEGRFEPLRVARLTRPPEEHEGRPVPQI
eukprot:274589-Prymnesium_polylepis.2